jgi:predicted nucleic acid-binding protein
MKRQIYIETTIASVYHETRTDARTVARREWTRQWWDQRPDHYEYVTSEFVIAELEDGTFPHQSSALEFARALPRLSLHPMISLIVNTYINHKVMPADADGDAMHLAIASYYKCEFLVTWNCRHLANARKFEHIRKINGRLGLFVPTLVTPLEISGWGVEP